MTRIAWLGVGDMGSRMARRLLDAGHEVTAWNRTASKAEALREHGASVAASPREAAGGAEAVVTMVADPEALRAVVEGPGGIRDAVAGRTLIEMSTVGPGTIGWLREALPDDAELMDAPVLGSLSEAEAGELRVFVGGSEAAFERWRPVFEALGTPLHAGPLGSGAAVKLVANLTLFGVLGVVGEAVALADGLGLDRDVAFEVLGATPVGPQVRRRRPVIEGEEPDRRFALELARKDADLILEAARRHEVDLRLAEAARSWLAAAEADGHGDRDYSAVLQRIVGGGGPDQSSAPDPPR